jgi:hypothetical protein
VIITQCSIIAHGMMRDPIHMDERGEEANQKRRERTNVTVNDGLGHDGANLAAHLFQVDGGTTLSGIFPKDTYVNAAFHAFQGELTRSFACVSRNSR